MNTSERHELPIFDIFGAITNILTHAFYKSIIYIYIYITKISRARINFRGPIRSHSPHGRRDAPVVSHGFGLKLPIACAEQHLALLVPSSNDRRSSCPTLQYSTELGVPLQAPPPPLNLLYQHAMQRP
jgi:hypothetical protein